MSDVVVIEGIAMYPKLFEHNRDRGSKVSEGAKYDYPEAATIQLVLDQENLKRITSALPKTKPRVTDNGIEVKLRRNWYNNTNPAWGGAPDVVGPDGDPWDPAVLIGNGSKVRCAVEVYDTKYGKSGRLMAVRVLDFVEADVKAEPDLPSDF